MLKNTIAFLFILCMSACHVVDAGHVGVWKKWGAVQPTIYDEGLYASMPIQSWWYNYPTRIQKLEGVSASSSKDLQNVTATIALNYRIDSTKATGIYRENGTIERLEATIIAPLLSEAVKASTANFTAEELITRRAEVKEDIYNQISAGLIKSGVIVTELSVNDFAFSHNFNEAIEAKVQAEQDALRAENELSKVEFEAKQAAAEAKGKAEAIIAMATANAEAQRILAKSITPQILQLRAIEKWDGDLPVVATEDGTFVDIAGVLKAKNAR